MVDAGKEVEARENLIKYTKIPEELHHYLENIISPKDTNLMNKLEPAMNLWHSRVADFEKVLGAYLDQNPGENREDYNDKLLFEFYQRWWAEGHGEGNSSESDVPFLAPVSKRPRGRPRKEKKKIKTKKDFIS